MATIPNRYYNSPWIADAARNLASALAPPDKDEQLRNEAARFNFERAKTTAGYEDTDRASRNEADELLGQLEGMQPIMDPATGKIDYAATDREARKLANAVVKAGGREYYQPTDKAMGTASPQHAALQAVLKAKAEYQASRDQNRAGLQITLADKREEGANARNAATNASHENIARMRTKADYDLAYARYKRDARAGGKNARLLPASTVTQAMDVLDSFESDRQAHMSLDDYNRVLALGLQYTDESGNVVDGILRALDETKPSVKNISQEGVWGEVFRQFGGDLTDPQLVPTFPTPAAAAPEVAVPTFPGDAPAPAPQTAPATGPKPDGKTIPIPVRTPEEAARLPKGTLIINPQGVIGRSKGPRP